MGKFGHGHNSRPPKESKPPRGPTDPSAMAVLGLTPPERPPPLPSTTLPQRPPSTGSVSSHGTGSNKSSSGQVSLSLEQRIGDEAKLTNGVAFKQTTTTNRAEEGQTKHVSAKEEITEHFRLKIAALYLWRTRQHDTAF